MDQMKTLTRLLVLVSVVCTVPALAADDPMKHHYHDAN